MTTVGGAGELAPGLAEVQAVRAAAATSTLRPLVARAEPAPGPILLSCVRNELEVLPDFLRHHREGGIRRFAIVDDASDDGTRELLAEQDDVELFVADERYSGTTSHAWFHLLIGRYGRHRWYVHADADEQLVFEGFDDLGFDGLVALADAAGQRRLRGALVDRYAAGPLLAPPPVVDGRLSEAFPLFDGGTHTEIAATVGIARRGGPRTRLLAEVAGGLDPELTKLPVFRLEPGETFVNAHALHPYAGNDGPCVIGINHFKFTHTFTAKLARAIEERTYWNGSAEYVGYAEAIARDPEVSLASDASRTYRVPEDLVREGVISPLAWPDPSR